VNILTFDIEEWFHILDNNSTKSEKDWENYEERIYQNMDIIFSFLDKNKLKATFFVVGWIANKYPDIVKRIDNNNFEIGSHTHMHQLLYELSPKEVENDLKNSISTIENLVGKKINCFRAPGFSLTQNNKWVFEILIENGIKYDCSIFPAGRAHGGFPSFKHAVPTIIKINGSFIKEFPINTTKFLGKKIIFSGGGYFRLFPYPLIKKFSQDSDYIMTYFHPRDFDPKQPMIKGLSPIRKFKSYVGLNKCLGKLDKWVNEFDFVDLRTADKIINWNMSPNIEI
tara:strand:- start:177 stop:1025 length:849 start_codon:yes stop_codon:yes gene_type:complete